MWHWRRGPDHSIAREGAWRGEGSRNAGNQKPTFLPRVCGPSGAQNVQGHGASGSVRTKVATISPVSSNALDSIVIRPSPATNKMPTSGIVEDQGCTSSARGHHQQNDLDLNGRECASCQATDYVACFTMLSRRCVDPRGRSVVAFCQRDRSGCGQSHAVGVRRMGEGDICARAVASMVDSSIRVMTRLSEPPDRVDSVCVGLIEVGCSPNLIVHRNLTAIPLHNVDVVSGS